MFCARHRATTLAAMLVYLAGLVGGALHQSDHVRPRKASTSLANACCVAHSSQRSSTDDDGCAICAAVHQAKVAPPAPPALTVSALCVDTVRAAVVHPFHTLVRTAQARAPPIV